MTVGSHMGIWDFDAGPADACPWNCGDPPPCHYATCTGGTCGIAPLIDGIECAFQGNQLGYCQAGACMPCVGCDDGNECTFDTCGAGGACVHYPIAHQQSCTIGGKTGNCSIDNSVAPAKGTCCQTGECLFNGACVGACPMPLKCGFYSGECE